jgi:hypothetical protein
MTSLHGGRSARAMGYESLDQSALLNLVEKLSGHEYE